MKKKKLSFFSVITIFLIIALCSIFYLAYNFQKKITIENISLKKTTISYKKQLEDIKKQFIILKNEDQIKKNATLEAEIKNIETTYNNSVKQYEEILKLKDQNKKTNELDIIFSDSLTYLSKRNFASAEAQLKILSQKIQALQPQAQPNVPNPANVAVNNTAPSSGSQRQSVHSDVGTFTVDVIAADLNSTRVIVDTASDNDCKTDCPVLSLGDYASRNGAFAAINGPYFCPAEYPSCADKKNSFDTLLMNKNKHYFNSDNNVYSTVPAVVFSGSSGRFVGQSLEWGRDTGVDSVLAAQPMLVSGGNVVFGGDDEVKRAGAGTRAFIGTTGNTVYIGVVYNANVAQVARVLKTMGILNALNLDSGGSIALWNNGRYLAGPGRNLPFGIVLVRK